MLRLAGTRKWAEPSFSTGTTPHCTRGQRAAFQLELLSDGPQRLPVDVYTVPTEIDEEVARLKLASMNITIDELTDEQRKYLSSWETGT
ncbi:hypothetical protein LCGC14_3070460 [marine sediment metagenome]|uniref:Adenosylhomocysteinase n=1 Tax=marine sediment metagenome TaxID=412755 RepID=A0A0F8X4L2_9ZZZZ